MSRTHDKDYTLQRKKKGSASYQTRKQAECNKLIRAQWAHRQKNYRTMQKNKKAMTPAEPLKAFTSIPPPIQQGSGKTPTTSESTFIPPAPSDLVAIVNYVKENNLDNEVKQVGGSGVEVPSHEIISIPQGDRFKVFEQPTQMIVAGPTKSGKTTLVTRIIKNKNIMFNPPPEEVYWFYTMDKSIEPVRKELDDDVIFIRGVATYSFLENKVCDGRPKIVVLDDMQSETRGAASFTQISNMFTRLSHHGNVTIIMLVQNMYLNKNMREITNQCENIIVMANGSSGHQMQHFATQQLGTKSSDFLRKFVLKNVKLWSSHGYFLISNGANDGVDKIRTGIFPGEKNTIFVQQGSITDKQYHELRNHETEAKEAKGAGPEKEEEQKD